MASRYVLRTDVAYEYEDNLKKFNIRANYITGLHVNATYTTVAHCIDSIFPKVSSIELKQYPM